MEQVILIHSQVGQLEAKILLSYEDKAVLLSQDRICVAIKEENNVYRMVSELKPLDLHYFLHFGA